MATDDELKMWLAVRTDLQMPAGKLAAQAGHAFVDLIRVAQADDPGKLAAYLESTTPKIIVQIKNLEEWHRAEYEAERAFICCAAIVDAGRTCFDGPTPTVIAFGPARRTELPPFLRKLRLYED